MTTSPEPATGSAHWRPLLPVVVPAVVVGALSSVALIAFTAFAGAIQGVLWDQVPDAIGIDGTGPAWTIAMLTVAGILTGLIVTFVPGHAGPDPATVGLADPPLPAAVLPGVALALIVTLAFGVSLGPENPIMGITIGLAVFVGARLWPRLGAPQWAGFAFAGTLGAMFGTPVAAALLLSEATSGAKGPLWDRLFGPLVAAGAGALTTDLISNESFVLAVAPYPGPQLADLVTGPVIAVGAAFIGMAAVVAFPVLHTAFQRAPSTLVALIVGGVILGILGSIGGPLTLFKGLDEMKRLTADAASYSAVSLAGLGVIKLVAMLVAGTAGFRGGRIFPAVFVGVALGLSVHAAWPEIPQALAVASTLVGILVAVTRSGWLSLFMAALMVGGTDMLPILCVVILPAWLVVTGRPEMIVKRPPMPGPAGA